MKWSGVSPFWNIEIRVKILRTTCASRNDITLPPSPRQVDISADSRQWACWWRVSRPLSTCSGTAHGWEARAPGSGRCGSRDAGASRRSGLTKSTKTETSRTRGHFRTFYRSVSPLATSAVPTRGVHICLALNGLRLELLIVDRLLYFGHFYRNYPLTFSCQKSIALPADAAIDFLMDIGSRILTLSLPRVINFKFLLQPHQKYYITQCEELGFSWLILRWKMIVLPILTTSLIHFSWKCWENVLFLPLEWKGKQLGELECIWKCLGYLGPPGGVGVLVDEQLQRGQVATLRRYVHCCLSILTTRRQKTQTKTGFTPRLLTENTTWGLRDKTSHTGRHKARRERSRLKVSHARSGTIF